MSAQQENRRRLEDMSQQELIQHIHHMQTEIRENFVPRFYHEQIANEEYDVPREQHAIFHVLNEDSRAMLAARAKLGGDIERVQALKGELTEAKRRWAEEHMVSTDEPVQPKELTLADDSIEESTSRVIEKMATRATIHGLRKRIEILQMLLGDHFSYHARYHRSQDAGQTRSRLCRFVMLFAQIMEVLETHNDGIDRLEGETGVAVRKIREWMKQELEFNWTKSAVG